MAFSELTFNKISNSRAHPRMNERRPWFDHDRDLIVVAVAEPREGHGSGPKTRRKWKLPWGSGTPFVPQFMAEQGI